MAHPVTHTRTLTDDEATTLIAEAKAAHQDSERARAAMLAAATRRQAAVRQLHDGGHSVRRIANTLGIHAATVQGILRATTPPPDQL